MPFGSWKLGRFADIDVYINSTFLIVPLLALLESGVIGAAMMLLVFGCVLLHEFGHALMARAYGIGTADITLYPIGGVARLERMPKSAGPELLIALAGPAVNLFIAAVLWAVLEVFGGLIGPESMTVSILANLMVINIGLLIFNMLPVFPMDGGRVLRALLTGKLGRFRATEIAVTVGRVIAVTAGVWFLLNGRLMQAALAGFVYFMGSMELRSVRLEEERRLAGSDWPTPPHGFRWVDRGDGVWRLVPRATMNVPPFKAGGRWN